MNIRMRNDKLCHLELTSLRDVRVSIMSERFLRLFTTAVELTCLDDFNLSSTQLPGWSRTRGSSTTSLLCWGTNSTGFPFVSGSNLRSRFLFATPYTVEVRLTCNPVREVDARAHLRSAERGDLTVPRIKPRRFRARSFRVSGLVVWNSLPEDISIPELSLERFKSMLKTHLFRQAYA